MTTREQKSEELESQSRRVLESSHEAIRTTQARVEEHRHSPKLDIYTAPLDKVTPPKHKKAAKLPGGALPALKHVARMAEKVKAAIRHHNGMHTPGFWLLVVVAACSVWLRVRKW